MSSKFYLLYDERALYDVDAAAVLTACGSVEEADDQAPSYGACVLYAYDDDNGKLVNEEYVKRYDANGVPQ